MVNFTYYIDYGSGFGLVNPQNNGLKLSLKRGDLNDYIQRKKLTGDFILSGVEATISKTFFIDNGNYSAPLRIYQNGTITTGVLKYEGVIKKKGYVYDERRNIITYNSFDTEDQYTGFLPFINDEVQGEQAAAFGILGSFAAQGQNTNSNKLYTVAFDGTNFAIYGATTSIPNLGRCSATLESGEVVVFDNVNATLKGYTTTVPNAWTEVRTATITGFRYDNTSIVGLGGGVIMLVSGGNSGFIQRYTMSGATFNAVALSDQFTEKLIYPCVALAGTTPVIVDESQSSLRAISISTGSTSNSLSIGNLKKPCITAIDPGNNRIALIDANKRTLQAYSYSAGVWLEVGNGFTLPDTLYEPKITRHLLVVNTIILHDAITGILKFYSFDGTNWAQTGNSASLIGGYSSCIAAGGTVEILIGVSDTFVFRGSLKHSYWGIVNSVLDQLGIQGASPKYELETTGNGSTVGVEDIIITDMSDVSDNDADAGSYDFFKYNLSDLLKSYELFQNYWYIDDDHKIKFIQPYLFSAVFGTNITLPSSITSELKKSKYKDEFDISQEKLVLNNSNSADWAGDNIKYDRDTPVIETKTFNFTTDLEYLRDIFTGQITKDINRAGLLMYWLTEVNGANLAVSGTGIYSGQDTKNVNLSISEIYENYWKDYRYQEDGNIEINGSTSAVQDTVRNIIEYDDVEVSMEQISITEFPDIVTKLLWGGGKESLIMNFEMDLNTGIITIASRLHDL